MESSDVWVSAMLCERALVENDGVISVIRVVDRFIITVHPAADPTAVPVLAATLVLIFRQVEGDDTAHTFGVEVRGADSTISSSGEGSLQMTNAGAQLSVPLMFPAPASGRYVVSVTLDGIVRQRLPLDVDVVAFTEPGDAAQPDA